MKKYSIGLDIGDASVGWAVVDENYNLFKFKKRNMWGVRLFEQAKTAANRRIHRTTTRRLNRRRERIRLLQELLAPIILEKDPTFFIRLEQSFLWQEDRKYRNKYNLFIDDNFTDKEYYKKFPTIYHLRKHLMESDKPEDPRLIYLALHHLIKYRGHFIYEGQHFQLDGENCCHLLKEIFDGCTEVGIIQQTYTEGELEEVVSILDNKNLKKEKRVEEALKALGVSDRTSEKQLLKLIVGLKCKIYKLFRHDGLLDEAGKEISVSLADKNLDEYIPIIEDYLQEYSYVIESIQNVYSLLILNEVLDGRQTISEAMCQRYYKYQDDLKSLKELFKKYHCMESYSKIFKEKSDNTYWGYVNKRGKENSRKNFYTLVKKEIESNKEMSNDSESKRILAAINDNTFMIHLNVRTNSTIPYQLHLKELELILEKQRAFHCLLQEEAEKIKSLLTFRIPYYVGPLNPHSEFSWVVKKSNQHIRPWNFTDVVDTSKSAEQFITRMTNYCTYLRNQPVLPECSILYSRFKMLNELNKIRIDDHLISQEEKEYVISTLFLKYKNVTKERFLEAHKQFTGSSKQVVVDGFQEENKFASSLKSEKDFIDILGRVDEKNIEMIEQIIYWITVFNDEKMVKQKIEENYSSLLSPSEIQRISRLKYCGWGRLSRQLLQGIKVTTPAQDKLTLMECLQTTNLNFMQLINSEKYNFKEIIENEYPVVKKDKITYEDVKNIYGSPAIKRGIWESIKVIQEIESVMGYAPQHIFVEMARSNGGAKRTSSRYSQLNKIYEKSEKQIEEVNLLQKQLKQAHEKKSLMKTRYYLYFMQLGKCMYSQKPLDINRLSDYQVDHIIPRSLIKDDSLDNLVLVETSRNQEKLNNKMPLEFIENPQRIKCFWEHLYKLNLITKKKYIKLTTKKLSEYQIQQFINRQLVETRQITKEVVRLLDSVYDEGVISTVKAQLVHDLRKQFNFPKCREINDYHHAHDAYLVSVLGLYIFKRFPSLDREFLYSEYLKYERKAGSSKNKFGFIISSMKNEGTDRESGEVVWHSEENIRQIRKILNYKDCYITKRLDAPYEFYQITLQPKRYGPQHKEQDEKVLKENVNLVSIKDGMDVKKYGGYKNVNEAFFVVAEYNSEKKKNQRKKKIVGIPVHIAYKIKNNQHLLNYLTSEECRLKNGVKNLTNAKILIPRILKYQLVETEGNLIYLTSSKEWINAKQLLLDEKTYQKIAALPNDNLEEFNCLEEDLINIYFILMNKMKEHYALFHSIVAKLEEKKDKFISLSTKDKVLIIKNILMIMQANSTNGNLKKIGLTDREGRLKGKSLNIEQTIFIYQSVTGMFEKRVRV